MKTAHGSVSALAWDKREQSPFVPSATGAVLLCLVRGLQEASGSRIVYHTPNLLAPSSWFPGSKELRIKFLLQMTQFKAFGHRTNFYMDFEWTA